MSWATCYSGSDNIHFSEPANMSDSRLFTHYNSSCQSNEKPYGYEDSDLKQQFLSKQQLESRMIAPSFKL